MGSQAIIAIPGEQVLVAQFGKSILLLLNNDLIDN
jgi:hypothetical protein